MKNKILIFTCLLLAGCAGASNVERKVQYTIECKNCITPYGRGDDLKLNIKKELKIDRNNSKDE